MTRKCPRDDARKRKDSEERKKNRETSQLAFRRWQGKSVLPAAVSQTPPRLKNAEGKRRQGKQIYAGEKQMVREMASREMRDKKKMKEERERRKKKRKRRNEGKRKSEGRKTRGWRQRGKERPAGSGWRQEPRHPGTLRFVSFSLFSCCWFIEVYSL